jgi:ectoine hydroxylase
MEAPEHVTWAGVPEQGRAAKVAAEVARDGWSLVGALDGALTQQLRRAVDEVAASSGWQLHLLSGLSRHPDLAEVVDWPPMDSRPSASSASSV